jgi:hypothetical protein
MRIRKIMLIIAGAGVRGCRVVPPAGKGIVVVTVADTNNRSGGIPLDLVRGVARNSIKELSRRTGAGYAIFHMSAAGSLGKLIVSHNARLRD